MTDELRNAQKAAQKAAAELARLQAIENERNAAVQARRNEREIEYNRQILASWSSDAERLSLEERAAYERFIEVLKSSDWFKAFSEYRSARFRRGVLVNRAQQAQRQLGRALTIPENTMYDSRILSEIVELAEQAAGDLATYYQDEIDSERDRFLSGDGNAS